MNIFVLTVIIADNLRIYEFSFTPRRTGELAESTAKMKICKRDALTKGSSLRFLSPAK